MVVSIDLSLRSTGVCFLNNQGELADAFLITPSPKEYNNEELLNYITSQIIRHMEKYEEYLDAVVIEGLAFCSLSGEKDKIYGNFWHLRCEIAKRFDWVPIGIIPVTEWRSFVLSKAEQREAKKSGEKDALKKACVDKLPADDKAIFDCYLRSNELSNKGLFDLCDAYHLGQYRISLGI